MFVVLKLENNIYPTYLDEGSQLHLNHEANQKVLMMTLAYQAEVVAHDCDVDDVDHHNYVDEVLNQMILKSPPSGLLLNAAPRQITLLQY